MPLKHNGQGVKEDVEVVVLVVVEVKEEGGSISTPLPSPEVKEEGGSISTIVGTGGTPLVSEEKEVGCVAFAATFFCLLAGTPSASRS